MYIPRFIRDLVRREVDAHLKDIERDQTRSARVRIFTENGSVAGHVTAPATGAGRRVIF